MIIIPKHLRSLKNKNIVFINLQKAKEKSSSEIDGLFLSKWY